jgi:hypothetical protein
MDVEIPLAGGNVAPVVRVGETVRRRAGPWTPSVHALLRHLADVGFDGAPRPLGLDEQGREVLTFVHGDCGVLPFEGADAGVLFTDQTLVAVGRLIRRFHDAVETFVPPADATWRVLPGAAAFHERAAEPLIIGHNDLAMFNTIYRDGVPSAFIDWDFAAPATRAWDLAYAAWRFVPLTNDDDLPLLGWAPVDRAWRLRRLCDAYGFTADQGRDAFLTTVLARVRATYDALHEWGTAGVSGFDRMLADGHADGVARDLRFIEARAGEWQEALDRA